MRVMLACLLATLFVGCRHEEPTSDLIQQRQQEQLLSEGTSQVGMPAIKNFRERKILKDIYELRDQVGLITYVYLENQIPRVVQGKTVLGGKLTYFGESVGYGIPVSTQFSNPQKIEKYSIHGNYSFQTLPQADPNGLFSPASADGTWVMMRNPKSRQGEPQYIEPRCVVLTYKLDPD